MAFVMQQWRKWAAISFRGKASTAGPTWQCGYIAASGYQVHPDDGESLAGV